MSDRTTLLDEARQARQQAQALLEALIAAQSGVDAGARKDLFRLVTGASSIEQAISTTRRTIETYDRIIDEGQSPADDQGAAPLRVCVPAASAYRGPWTVAALYESRTA
jgi:hypothetical protein